MCSKRAPKNRVTISISKEYLDKGVLAYLQRKNNISNYICERVLDSMNSKSKPLDEQKLLELIQKVVDTKSPIAEAETKNVVFENEIKKEDLWFLDDLI